MLTFEVQPLTFEVYIISETFIGKNSHQMITKIMYICISDHKPAMNNKQIKW